MKKSVKSSFGAEFKRALEGVFLIESEVLSQNQLTERMAFVLHLKLIKESYL